MTKPPPTAFIACPDTGSRLTFCTDMPCASYVAFVTAIFIQPFFEDERSDIAALALILHTDVSECGEVNPCPEFT